MTILITGGTGFLGSYFTRYALGEGERRVVVLDRYVDRGRIADVVDRVDVIEGDVADPEMVSSVIQAHSIDRIAHFAFILGSPARGQMVPYVRVQTLGTATVFEAARQAGVKRVLFSSSVAAYGRQTAPCLTEGEGLARHYTEELGLEIARVENAVRGAAIEMPGGDATADFTYAADAAQAAWLALTAPRLPNHIYNVCGEHRPVKDFTAALRALLPTADIKISDREQIGHPHPPMDGGLLRKDLGFAPKYSLAAGLADYVTRIRSYDTYSKTHA